MLNQNLLLTADAGGYNISRSLRLRASASAYLSRSITSTGDRQKFTISKWFKRGAMGAYQGVIQSPCPNPPFGNTLDGLRFNSSDQLEFLARGGNDIYVVPSMVFRDPAAYYHVIVAVDTTQATASNRVKFYVNGNQITSFAGSTYPSQNYNMLGWNVSGYTNVIGCDAGLGSQYFDGYTTESIVVDGQQLDASSFGEFDAITGVWKPKRYAGTYGTNGFKLDFSDNSAATAAAIGKDSSGNGNNWTPNNISLSAGATYDSMLDVPTLTSASASNFCVLNPLSRTSGTVSDGNLKFVGSGSIRINGTMAVNSGKWYYEVNVLNAPYSPRASNTWYNSFGFGPATFFGTTASPNTTTDTINYQDSGYYKNGSGSNTDTGSAVSSGDVLAVAVDLDANTFTFYKNNSSVASGTIGITAGTPLVPMIISYDGSYGAMAVNFGQRPFAYTPPTGFKALNTFNLPDSTILAGNKHFDATLYNGNSSTQTIVNAGGFQPDFVWTKGRSQVRHNALYNSVVGTTYGLHSNETVGDINYAGTGVSSFNSNGFSLGNDSDSNWSSSTYVGWQWKGGGSAVSNTSGSITSQVSANTSAGFSVVTYTGTGSAATVGHGLGVAPAFMIFKDRTNGSYNWAVWHQSLGGGDYALQLNNTNASTNAYDYWNGSPSSTVFGLGTDFGVNKSGDNYVAYCFAEVAGYSKFGSYIGNGSTDGPFVYCGFRPRWLMIKITSGGTGNWEIVDSARNTYNQMDQLLLPSSSNAESNAYGSYYVDFTSNGFKIRGSGAGFNASGETLIYAAFAENPFKNSLAR